MEEKIDWQDLVYEIDKRGIKGAAICNGQHIIDIDNIVVGYVSTPIGEDPCWIFYSKPSYEANQSLKNKAVLISNTSLEECLFQASTKGVPPFKTSTQLQDLLERLLILENE